jgi:hypothetical protein
MTSRARGGVHAALAATPYAIAVLYAALVMQHGIPALRHDWAWPANPAAIKSSWTTSTSGWDPRGIGSPNLHLNDYLVGGALALVGWLLGPAAALGALLLGIGISCALGAQSLARICGAPPFACAGAALFCVFNPWAYTETVAGHTYMLLSFGGLIALCAELLRERPRSRVAAFLVALTLVQLQFFFVALALVALAALQGRTRIALWTALIVASAPLLGVAADFGSFRGVPITLSWESSQSTPVFAAARLAGYFAGYGQRIDPFDQWAMIVIIGLTVVGVTAAWRTAAARYTILALAISIGVAAGFDGWLAAPLAWTFAKVPASGLYRELFDVLGFAVIAYVAGASLAAARSGIAAVAFVGASAVLAAAWFMWSPWAWWVPSASIQSAEIDGATVQRFALVPAFQPLTFLSHGSGLDPDAFVHGTSAPLNVQSPQYPVDAALARYVQRDDDSWLAALGVSRIIDRPWLQSDEAARAHEIAFAPKPAQHPNPPADAATASRAVIVAGAQPLVAILPTPSIGTVDDDLGAGAVFFGDAAQVRGAGVPPQWSTYRPLIAVSSSGRFVDAADGWVDARLAFSADPRLAQAFGGAMTTSSAELLPVTASVPALVFVDGELRTQSGRLVSGSTRGYRWIALGTDVNALRCSGTCAVAAQGYPPAIEPAKPRTVRPISFQYADMTPWLIPASIPAGGSGMLRLNVAFDRGWLAFAGGASLPHVRVDATVNGWLLQPRTQAISAWMIQWPAAVEAVLEAIGAAWLIALAVAALLAARRGAAT